MTTLSKFDYEHARDALIKAAIELCHAIDNADDQQTAFAGVLDCDAATDWFNEYETMFPHTAKPYELKNLHPLIVAISRLALFEESPTTLEKEYEGEQDEAIPGPFSLVQLRWRLVQETNAKREARRAAGLSPDVD